ncbi:unnamed protein product, partial [Nesidiocoris tenuis]
MATFLFDINIYPNYPDGDGDTQISAPKSSGRFTCTSVGEEVQLVTTTSSSVSTGFSMDPPTTPTPTTPIPTPTTPSPATIGFFPPEVAPITSTISDDIPAIPRDRIDSSEDSADSPAMMTRRAAGTRAGRCRAGQSEPFEPARNQPPGTAQQAVGATISRIYDPRA